ncbi:phosphate transport system permease protein [Catellatospora sp. TT07R-123]|uniref:phosphate ABC transporter permease subunit PstC n=1 Tax=Catellatospora sp. TT07R-123 TaxID=2733863 RepID=UPI001B294F95|nr:phosphate ABC transporter permease subunit PstC [Catellatospora sp. TT07R-123]GHJ49232.1 phosphate transport system permease protein [Catellatospora sp. TT07R-123]
MTATVQVQPDAPAEAERRRRLAPSGGADLAFRALLRTAGAVVLAIMAIVGLFLAGRAGEAVSQAGPDFVTTQNWEPDSHNFGIAAVLVGTFLIALVAISLAVPLATGMALFISEYATGGLQRFLIGLVDLMAAVPSVVYGLWGVNWLQPNIVGLSRWLATYCSWIPFLRVDGYDPGDPLSPQTVFTSSSFIAGVVVALMITPIVSSIMREVFSQAPLGEREGAYALGGTRWGMIRTVVLPFGRGGMIGGTMLGLGRAMGETIAIYMIISPVFVIQPHLLQNGASSISSLIALKYGSASPFGTSALMAAGFALFLVTLAVNFLASMVIARSRSGAQSEV